MKTLVRLLVVVAFLLPALSFGQAPPKNLNALSPMEEFLALEAINETSSRSIPYQKIVLEHLEFPIGDEKTYLFDNYRDWLVDAYGKGQHGFYLNKASYLPREFGTLISFVKNGQLYARFFIHPEDTTYGERVKSYLEKRGIPYEVKKEYQAQRAASRSLIIFDHVSGRHVSYRPSTSRTLQDYRARPNPIHWAHLSRGISDYYRKQQKNLEVLKIAFEAAAYGFPTTNVDGKLYGDITSQIRLMDEVSSGRNRHFSGFIMSNPEQVDRLAERAGMNAQEFTRQVHYLLGKAQVELSFILGFHYTSAHGQNYRVELTPEGKLTGKIVLLDLTDGRPIAEIFELKGQHQLVADWDKMAGSTNPVRRGEIGISKFSLVRSEIARTAMADGAEARLREIGNVSEEVIQAVRNEMLKGAHSERGNALAVPDPARHLRVSPAPRSCLRLFAKP